MEELHPWECEEEILKKEVSDEKFQLELKVLPSNLKYAFLDDDGNKPVIISNILSDNEENRLIQVLRKNQEAMGWTLSDLKGINPSYSMHRRELWRFNHLMRARDATQGVRVVKPAMFCPSIYSCLVIS